jgi:hypothetical protein
MRPIQFTSPQFFKPVLTEVLVTYVGRLCRQHSRMWFRIYIDTVKGIWLKEHIPILISITGNSLLVPSFLTQQNLLHNMLLL